MAIQKLEVRILVDNSVGAMGVFGEWGFSALVDVHYTDESHRRVLLDTGSSPDGIRHNVAKMEIDLSSIDAVVLSHGHKDHVAGLKTAASLIGKRIPLVCHPHALQPKIWSSKGKEVVIGIQEYYPSLGELEKDFEIITSIESYELFKSVKTTGMIPRSNNFEHLTGELKENATRIENGVIVPDNIDDDLSLVFQMADNSQVILVGCCHAGIVNTIKQSEKITGSKQIKGIIGGFHLFDATDERLTKTIQELKKYPIELVAPCHCSGTRGQVAFYNAFKDKYREIGTGSFIEIKN